MVLLCKRRSIDTWRCGGIPWYKQGEVSTGAQLSALGSFNATSRIDAQMKTQPHLESSPGARVDQYI